MAQKLNKHGEKLYPIKVAELDTNTRMTVWWTMEQLSLAHHLATTGGLMHVEDYGYFYRFEEYKQALAKAFENPYWLKLLTKS